MIKSSKYPTVIHIDHGANPAIAVEIKLNTINIDKLNFKLIKISTYLSQFKLDVCYRFEKFNVISNVLNKLPEKSFKKTI